MIFFLFSPFLFLPHSLYLFFISTATKRRIQSKPENFFSHKPNEIRKIKEKREERDLFMSKRINPNIKQNPILKIKLNQNKQIWKKKKRKKKNKLIWPSRVVGRMTSGDGAVDVVVLYGERRSPPVLSFRRPWSPSAVGQRTSFLSLSLMWSECEMLECSWGEKENKRSRARHLCGGEKQEKEKRKRKKRHAYGWKWNERKKNNIKNKKF